MTDRYGTFTDMDRADVIAHLESGGFETFDTVTTDALREAAYLSCISEHAIDVTPTWEAVISEMLRILPFATSEGARDIHGHILHAARVADLYVAGGEE